MTPKQKAIAEAYKALGMNVPDMADENGWAPISLFQSTHVQEHFYDVKQEGKILVGRPILLDGLDDNKGWKRVEDGLPEESFGEYFIFADGEVSPKSFTFFTSDGGQFKRSAQNFPKEKVTHYMPINKPEPPLY